MSIIPILPRSIKFDSQHKKVIGSCTVEFTLDRQTATKWNDCHVVNIDMKKKKAGGGE
jgi:hypothetical protein